MCSNVDFYVVRMTVRKSLKGRKDTKNHVNDLTLSDLFWYLTGASKKIELGEKLVGSIHGKDIGR